MSIYMGGTSKSMIPVLTRPPILSPHKDIDYNMPMPIHERLPNLKFRDLPNNHQPFLSARAPLPRSHNRSFNGYQVFEPYNWSVTRRYIYFRFLYSLQNNHSFLLRHSLISAVGFDDNWLGPLSQPYARLWSANTKGYVFKFSAEDY